MLDLEILLWACTAANMYAGVDSPVRPRPKTIVPRIIILQYLILEEFVPLEIIPLDGIALEVLPSRLSQARFSYWKSFLLWQVT